jgi:outer membrane lipoprotein-sorting protein
MRFLRRLVVALALMPVFLAGAAGAAEFSAVMVTQAGGQEMQGKIYVKGDKMRQERTGGGMEHIIIYDKNAKAMWMITPAQKMYMEMPITDKTRDQMAEAAKDIATKKLIGSETVNGYAADKYETTVKTGDGEMTHFVWIAKKLGIPIKMESPDGSFRMEYRDIKEGGVSDDLFRVPEGYQKMTMPGGMGGGMRGRMPKGDEE